MDLSDALAYLDAHLNREATAGRIEGLHLDHMRRLTEVLGDPQRSYPVIHITGTNGKGSVARMVTALLVESGLSVGTYASPHLVDLNERIAWNGEPISDEDLAATIGHLAAIEPLTGITPSWFELVTAAALAWFAEVAVDVAVIEVGLLGRFDATNVVDADVAVITNIGFDHTDGVGDWRRAIASEKAGIVKPGSFLVLGEPDDDLAPVFLAEQPRQVWTRDVEFMVDVDLPAVGGRLVDLRTPNGVHHEVYLPVHGAHQAANASIAVAAVEAFFGRALESEVVEAGFAGLTIPGRLEVVGRAPLVLVDGAHNPSGAVVVAEAVEEDFEVAGRRTLVVGMLEGRDPAAMLEALDLGRYDLVITCAPDSPRAIDAAELAAVAGELGAVVEIEPDVSTAVDRALQLAGEDDLILITGSLYVVGAARAHLRPDADLSDARGSSGPSPDQPDEPLSAYERAKLGLFDDDDPTTSPDPGRPTPTHPEPVPFGVRFGRRDGTGSAQRFGKKMPISRSADSRESEPCTRFSVNSVPRSPRMVPGSASSGLVVPIIERTAFQVSPGPSSTNTRAGERPMNSTSSP